MWHSSSTQVWQNHGGEGFKDMFLKRDYPVYFWDGPRVARAHWSCKTSPTRPEIAIRETSRRGSLAPLLQQAQFPTQSEWYPGVQFPTKNTQA